DPTPQPAGAPSPEEIPVQPPAALDRPSLDPGIDDFDEALALLAASLLTEPVGPTTAEPPSAGPVRGTGPILDGSSLLATAAVAAGGARLLLREPDKSRRRGWSPRFSTR